MNKLKIALGLALIVVSTTFAQTQTYDRAKIWDKEIDALTEIDSRQTPPEKAVLFVGSSSIRGWRTLRQDFPGLKFINRGFGGSRLEDTNHYFDRIVAPYNPRIVVLYAGENDVNDGLAPERVAADFKRFTELVRQKLPKTRIIYISLKPSPSRWKLADKFRQTNYLIKAQVARDKRAVFVDVWPAMLNEKGEPRPELFLNDMLHMKENGYEIWRGLLAKHLK
jgi:lysophospholipase L1-like esterase